jgi:hypothetical protein
VVREIPIAGEPGPSIASDSNASESLRPISFVADRLLHDSVGKYWRPFDGRDRLRDRPISVKEKIFLYFSS